MSIKVTTEEAFQGENAVRSFLDHTEQKEYKERMVKEEVLFELAYWAGRLSKKIFSVLKDPREALQKLNDEFGIDDTKLKLPLKEVLGEKLDEFTAKRTVIMDSELEIDLFSKKARQFKTTGAGGFVFMGLLPFLIDDMEVAESKKNKKANK